MTSKQSTKSLFKGSPRKGAEYFGGCAVVSIVFGSPEEAAARTRVAVRYARRVRRTKKGTK